MTRVGILSAGTTVCATLGLLVAVGAPASPWGLWLPLGALVTLLGGVAAGVANPRLQLFGPSVCSGSPALPRVALTFDDGPDPRSTEALVQALDRVGARGTFFLLLDRALQQPELVARIAQRHEVGLHGQRHDTRWVFQDPARTARQMREAAIALGELVGRPVTLYRPPFGVTSPRLAQAVTAAGLRTVWCSVRTLDGLGGTVARTVRRGGAARAGDIVLLHEGARPAREALPAILDLLAARDLRSVTVSEMIGE